MQAVLRDQDKDLTALMAATVGQTRNMTYSTAGTTQPIRIYTSEGVAGQPLPVIAYVHGGGWVIADLDTHEASAIP